jgi:hypothetical protein
VTLGTEDAVDAHTISFKSNRLTMMFVLAALAAVSLAFVWGGARRMMRMQTQAAGKAEFAQVKADEQTKIVIEVAEASGGRIRGKLLEKRDETHYSRTENPADVTWGKETGIAMGKAEDIHRGAVVHITGQMGADRSVEAKQIVILTGYVQVK